MSSPRLKILYIAGCSRTGSTIVGGFLGQVPGCAYVGELREVWDLVVDDTQLCGCGAPLQSCSFWRRVFDRAFGGLRPDLAHAYSNLIRIERPVRTRELLLRPPQAMHERMKTRYAKVLRELRTFYGAIADSAGADVIVDGSKYPSYAFLLGAMADVELHVLHLVRDPRAVAYSWAKRTKQDPRAKGFGRMEAKGLFHTCRSWNERNLLTRRIWGGDRARYVLLRYEDFVSDPVASLQPVLLMVGRPEAALPLIDSPESSAAVLASCHSVGGNPSRFATGRVSLRLDSEWSRRLHPAMRHAVSFLTYPWLRTYGYSASLPASPQPTGDRELHT